MTFVITNACCSDGACAIHCPVQCIRPRAGEPDYRSSEQLYIEPATCIECTVCRDVCPVDAIYADVDLPPHLTDYLRINAEHFVANPIVDWTAAAATRRRLPPQRPTLRVAVVGSGPAGCYAVQELCRIPGVEVSLFDKLPTPFGLVRAGVAPDHHQTKRVVDQFDEVLSGQAVRCYFHVDVGRDITIGELLDHHHAVVYAAGADADRRLGIPGEDLPGSHAAREFVAWYNGHPDFGGRGFDLTGTSAVIIGNGNVALDAARALVLPPQLFRSTDMADYAVDALHRSGIRDVHVVARRGPESGAYTLAEWRSALSNLDEVELCAVAREAVLDARAMSVLMERGMPDALARKLEIAAHASRAPANGQRRIFLRYLLTPVSINGRERVESVTFARNEVTVTDGEIRLRATGQSETFETGLVLRAVGSRGHPVPGLPFDDATGTIPNVCGQVVDPSAAAPLPGLYCAGWIKRGATGVIGTNRQCSNETVERVFADFVDRRLAAPKWDREHLEQLVRVRQPDVVDYEGWLRIDAAELARATANRPRAKFTDIGAMLDAARI